MQSSDSREVGLGGTPGFGGTETGSSGWCRHAKQLIYTARNIKAADDRIGLVNGLQRRIVDADGNVVKVHRKLLAAAQKMASTIAKNAPIAVRNCKKAINDGLQVDIDQAIVVEEKLFGDASRQRIRNGMAFFLDKNKEKLKRAF